MKSYDVKFVDLEKTSERIAYREAGLGEKTILLVHGNMTSSVHFQPLMEFMEKSYKVYALDMVGFGDSSYNRQINSLNDFSKDVVAFIEELNLKDVYILGWSTGGGVVLEVAADIPDRIKKVFLQSSVGVQGYPMFKKDEEFKPIMTELIYKREDIKSDPVQVVPALKAYELGDREYFRNVWNLAIYNKHKPDKDDYELYIDAILKQRNLVDVDVALANFNMTGDFNGINEGSDRLKLVQAPVVILQGDEDMVVPKEFADLTKKYLGEQAELVIFESCGHSIITDDLERYHMEIVKRLD